MNWHIRIAIILVLNCVLTCEADTLHLNDGSSLQGRVIDQGEKYWIKEDSGQSHLVDKSSVTSWTQGPDAAPSVSVSPTARGTGASGSRSFAAVKTKVDKCDTAIEAVGLWQSFIDSKPASADLTAANAEMKHWREILNGRGEKINGKWIWGEERDKLLARVRSLIVQGSEALRGNQTLEGIAKFEEALKLDPDSFEANFELGYFNLVKGISAGRNNAKIDQGVKSMETAVALRPDCAEALSDLSIAYNFEKKYQLSVDTAYKAVKLEDTKEIVQNLVNSIAYAPPGMQNSSRIKPILQETLLLAEKYGISPHSDAQWEWVRPSEKQVARADGDDDDHKEGPPGIIGDGTGFFIASNGYILTNRHVAKEGDYLMVRLPDNTLKLADRVVIDDEQDMAVIKINTATPVPFVRLAAYDTPAVGADVAVFGFPMQSVFGLNSSVKMTRGIVTAVDRDNELCDITVDAAVNPGNSGGPMVDRHGNLLALTAMKTRSMAGSTSISSYGLGYSDERVRKFFKKQQEKLAAANLSDGSDQAPVLTNEELAARLTPATVCILVCRGKAPTMDAQGSVREPSR